MAVISCTSEVNTVNASQKDGSSQEDIGTDTAIKDASKSDTSADLTEKDADMATATPTVQLRLFNVFRGEEDPRFEDIVDAISTIQLTPNSTLAFVVPEKYKSVRITWAGGEVVDTDRPFRLNDSGLDAEALDWTGVENATFDIEMFETGEATGESVAVQRSLIVNGKGADPTPEEGEHRRINFWVTSDGVYVRNDAEGNFIDSAGVVVLENADVSLEMTGDANDIGYLRSTAGKPTLDFAFILLIPDGYEPTTPYPLLVFLHNGSPRFRGSDNDGSMLGDPQFNGQYSIINSLNRTENTSLVIIPQLYERYVIDGVSHEWAAFTGIEKTTEANDPRAYSMKSSPNISLNSVPLLKLIDDILAGQFSFEDKTVTLDPARLYLTGNSMGGTGTWGLMGREPTRWAAGMPMSGYGDHDKAAGYVDQPIWAHHHELDCINPTGGTIELFGYIKDTNGGTEIKLTVDPPLENLPTDDSLCRAVHSRTPQIWNLDRNLYTWLFSQVNKNK